MPKPKTTDIGDRLAAQRRLALARVDVQTAADAAGCSLNTAYRRITAGAWPATREGGRWLVHSAPLRALLGLDAEGR